jgi:hypothetical protein
MRITYRILGGIYDVCRNLYFVFTTPIPVTVVNRQDFMTGATPVGYLFAPLLLLCRLLGN